MPHDCLFQYRQSPSGKPQDFDNGLYDKDFWTSQGRHFGDSPGRYPKPPKRRSIFEHDPWNSGPEGSDSAKGAFTSSSARTWRDRFLADLFRDASSEGPETVKDESHLAAGNASRSSPVDILPRRFPSPGLLSLIELERKGWLLDGNRRHEQILKHEHFRRLKSDVDVLTELAEPADIHSSSKPKLSIPMPGTNLPLFSPNEDSFQTATTFPGDYFGQPIPREVDIPKALTSAIKTLSERTASSETLVAAKEAERRDSDSDSWSCASRNDSAVVISGEMLRHYDALAEDDPIHHEETKITACQLRGIVLPPEVGSEQTQDRDLTALSDASSNQTVAENKDLRITGNTQLGPMPAERPPKVELRGIPGQVDGLAPLQLDEPAMPLDEEGYNTETNMEFNASQARTPLEAGPMKNGTTGSPQQAANDKEGDGGFRFTTPNNSPFDSPTMGSTGMFKQVRAERLHPYQELATVPGKLGTESSPVALEPAFSRMQTADTSLSGLPSSSPRTPEKFANKKAFRGSIKRTGQHATSVNFHRGKHSRKFREWSMPSRPASDPADPAAESGLGSPTSPQPFISISGLPRPVTPPNFEHFDLPLRLRQATPITIIRLDDLDFEDNNRPFVAARLPRFGPPTPEHVSKGETVAKSRTPSSLLGEPSTPILYSQFSPHSSDIATPDGSENASPCPIRQPSPIPWKLDVMYGSKLTPRDEESNPGGNIGTVEISKIPRTPKGSDRADLPSVGEWLKSHNLLKNAKGLEGVG